MKQNPPAPSNHRDSGSAPSGGLGKLGILLLGVGLGALATAWLTPAPSTPVGAGHLLSWIRPAQGGTDVSSATVCVKTPKGWGEQACASGVSIDPQLVGIDPAQGSVVLTNYHVIADMGNRPPLQLGGKGEVFAAEIIRSSTEFDLALLLVPDAKFPIAALAEASPAQGTAVRAIGFPNDQPLTVKNSALIGTTQNCLAVAPCLALQQGTITFGNSGGPLEAGGKVIGITQGEIEDELAIPVEQIRQFLSGQVPANRQSSGSQWSPESPGSSQSPQFEPDYFTEPHHPGMSAPMEEPPYPADTYPAYPPYPPYPMEAPPYPAW